MNGKGCSYRSCFIGIGVPAPDSSDHGKWSDEVG
jgi:hypothetical protein